MAPRQSNSGNRRNFNRWNCSVCTREFKYQYTLLRHMPVHTNVRNFHCNLCSKSFRQLSTLSQHKATHTNIRPYKCSQCQKSFNRVSTLISHKKIHQQTKRYICHVCGKGFHQKGNLRNHIYTHTNERPYKCDICQKGFNQRSNLVCHKTSAHGEKKVYKCPLCPASFSRESAYTSHINSGHSKKREQPAQEKRSRAPRVNQLKIPAALIDEKEDSKEKKCQVANETEIDFKLETSSEVEEVIPSDTNQRWSLIVRRKPTPLMERALADGQIIFVLFYKLNDETPKICKASLGVDGYVLTCINEFEFDAITFQGVLKVPVCVTIKQIYDANLKMQSEFIEYCDFKVTCFQSRGSTREEVNPCKQEGLTLSPASSFGSSSTCTLDSGESSRDGFLPLPIEGRGEVSTAAPLIKYTDGHVNVFPPRSLVPPEVKTEGNPEEENPEKKSTFLVYKHEPQNDTPPEPSGQSGCRDSGAGNSWISQNCGTGCSYHGMTFTPETIQEAPLEFDAFPHWLSTDIGIMEENNNICSSPPRRDFIDGSYYMSHFMGYYSDPFGESTPRLFDSCPEDFVYNEQILQNNLAPDVKIEGGPYPSYQNRMPPLD